MFTLRVQDFQSLEDVTLVVDGFTVLTGTNNGGKSATIRALMGLFQNNPDRSFVRYGKDSLKVTVTFDDGNEVCWEKGPKVNRYTINGKTLDKVGNAPPQEVLDLGVFPLEVAGKEVWPQFAPQFEHVFLLDRPGSFIAEAISDAETVGLLNDALRKCQSDRKSVIAERDVRVKDLLVLDAEQKSFEGFDVVSREVDALVQRELLIRESRSECDAFESLSMRFRDSLTMVGVYEGLEGINVPSQTFDFQAYEDMTRLSSNFRTLKQQLMDMDFDVQIPDAAEIGSEIDTLVELESLTVKLQKVYQVQHILGSETVDIPPRVDLNLDDDLETMRSRLRAASEDLVRIDREIQSVLAEQSEVEAEVHRFKGEGQCPFCGSP